MNKARNKNQIDIKFLEKKITELKSTISNKDIIINQLRHEYDNADAKLMILTQERDDLVSKLTISERHYDQAQKQYEERLASINEIAQQNRKKKENWASNFEKEQKAHAETMEELIKTQTKLKETEMALNNLKVQKFNRFLREYPNLKSLSI